MQHTANAKSAVQWQTTLIHTGQHYDVSMSDVFFEQLGIRTPDVHLNIGSGSHGFQTGKLLIAIEEYLLNAPIRPCGVVVVGDVNSTAAATLAAVKLGIPVAHVEAGLRSFDRGMPEEINRLVTDAIADLLLVSEPAGMANLAREGIASDKIRYVGNVMIDTLVQQLSTAKQLRMPTRLGLVPGQYGVITLHRPSNVDDPTRLQQLTDWLIDIAKKVPLVFPVHPRTSERLEQFGLATQLRTAAGMHWTTPLGYRENLGLMSEAKFVLTDSGGVQEETTFLNVPCLTLRNNTERPVTVTQGTNTLVGQDLSAARKLVDEICAGTYKSGQAIEGWDGRAAERIVELLIREWG